MHTHVNNIFSGQSYGAPFQYRIKILCGHQYQQKWSSLLTTYIPLYTLPCLAMPCLASVHAIVECGAGQECPPVQSNIHCI